MKSLKLKKIIAVAVAALTITALSSVGASAEWKQDSRGWWNTEGNSYSVGWKSIDGAWYYFDASGYMKTGWVNAGGKWYYMQPSGAMKTGWVSDGNKWYYTAPSGEMQTGWVNDGGKWYFTEASGEMKTGLIEVAGKVYYLASSGEMQTGNVTIDGTTYTFATSGEAVGDKVPAPTATFESNGVETTTKPTDAGNNEATTISSGGGGGSSSSSGSSNNSGESNNTQPTYVETFQDQINRLYGVYGQYTINNKTDNHDGTISFQVNLQNKVDNKETQDFVTQDVFVTDANGTDIEVKYNNGVYTVKSGAKVQVSVRVYRSGQIGYVTTTPYNVTGSIISN